MYGPPRDHLQHRLGIVIDPGRCVGCTLCIRFCPLGNVLELGADGKARRSREQSCAGCMRCLDRCPNNAISVVRR